jgi:hypothetical protein
MSIINKIAPRFYETRLRRFILTIFCFHRKAAEAAKKRYFSFAVERTAKEKITFHRWKRFIIYLG